MASGCCADKSGKGQLTQCLIAYDGSGIGQIQAPGILTHGDAQTAVGIPFSQPCGEARSFFPEDKITTVPEFRIGIRTPAFCGSQPEICLCVRGKEILQTVIGDEIHHGPIVQTGAFHGFFRDIESERPYEMKA